jgi:phosphoglucomutase
MGLLAAKMTAVMGRDPGELYQQLTYELGEPVYQRLDAQATPEQKRLMAQLSPQQITATELAGETITDMFTTAPGDGAAIGGLKVMTANGWFAARPSGTEDVYKIYAESFEGETHLHRLIDDAQALIDKALASVPQQSEGGGHY